MTLCKIPQFCERYKIDIEIYDLKSKQTVPRNVKQKDVNVYINKNYF